MNITIRLTKIEYEMLKELQKKDKRYQKGLEVKVKGCLLYTSPSPRDKRQSRMPSSA